MLKPESGFPRETLKLIYAFDLIEGVACCLFLDRLFPLFLESRTCTLDIPTKYIKHRNMLIYF